MRRGYLQSTLNSIPLSKLKLDHTDDCELGGRNRTEQCLPCMYEDVVRRLQSTSVIKYSDAFTMVSMVFFKMYLTHRCLVGKPGNHQRLHEIFITCCSELKYAAGTGGSNMRLSLLLCYVCVSCLCTCRGASSLCLVHLRCPWVQGVLRCGARDLLW